jgi:hypothetical protein
MVRRSSICIEKSTTASDAELAIRKKREGKPNDLILLSNPEHPEISPVSCIFPIENYAETHKDFEVIAIGSATTRDCFVHEISGYLSASFMKMTLKWNGSMTGGIFQNIITVTVLLL